MDDTHDLTDKEIKALKDGMSAFKKVINYISRINTENRCLRENLEESIKAGDVTNEQKVQIRCYKSAEEEAERIRIRISEKCQEMHPGCTCPESMHCTCGLYQEFLTASWLLDLAHGSRFAWEQVFEYAAIGRKLWNAMITGRSIICGSSIREFMESLMHDSTVNMNNSVEDMRWLIHMADMMARGARDERQA